MLIAGFPAGPWGTNCYVVATGPGTECVVVDPGKDAAAGVAEVVREHRLKPVAVLVTHGHVDHMWCVAPVAGTYDATAWIHPGDRHLLTDPMAGHVAARPPRCCSAATTSGPSPTTSASSSDAPGARAGRACGSWSTTRPGHTEGSVTFRTPYAAAGRLRGDVLRRPALRRLDRPHRPARRRPRHDAAQPGRPRCCRCADDIVVLPGHGEQTSIGRERATNPFLLDLADDGSAGRVTRGL